jgi:undecaprenyl pyrophosphate synthase
MQLTNPLYSLYNKSLQERLRRGPLPYHIGVILDGNRRFARDMGYQDVSLGHRAGVKRSTSCSMVCQLSIPVTLGCSPPTTSGGVHEVSIFFDHRSEDRQPTYSPVTYQRRYRIRILGRRRSSCIDAAAIREVEERTRSTTGRS